MAKDVNWMKEDQKGVRMGLVEAMPEMRVKQEMNPAIMMQFMDLMDEKTIQRVTAAKLTN